MQMPTSPAQRIKASRLEDALGNIAAGKREKRDGYKYMSVPASVLAYCVRMLSAYDVYFVCIVCAHHNLKYIL